MSVEQTIAPQAPQLRCYQCGSPEIHAICHHCHRPMCWQHTAFTPGVSFFQENREFVKLGLESRPTQTVSGAHCAAHARGENHPIPAYRRIMVYPGLLIALIALFFVSSAAQGGAACLQNPPQPYTPGIGATAEALRDPASRSALPEPACYQPELLSFALQFVGWAALLGLAVVTTGYGILLDQDKYQAQLHGRVPVPLTPRSRGIIARETLTGRITLNADGQYREQIIDRQGVLDPQLEFTTLDRQRLHLYEKKYKLQTDVEPFAAGYLQLLGAPRIQLAEVNDPQTRLLPLNGRVADHPYLLNQRGRANGKWDLRWPYRIDPAADEGEEQALPVRLVLNRQQRGNGHRLGLSVQIPDVLYRQATPDRLTIRKLTLYIPASLPQPQNVYPQADVTPYEKEGRAGSKIVWRNLNFLSDDGQQLLAQRQLWIEFPYLPTEPAELTGELSAIMEAAPSGLAHAYLYSPMGHRLHWSETDDARLNLTALPSRQRGRKGCLRGAWDWLISQGGQVIKENLPQLDTADEEAEVEQTTADKEKPSLRDLFNNPDLSRSALKPQLWRSQEENAPADGLPIHSQLAIEISFALICADMVYHERYGRRQLIPLDGIRPDYETARRLVEAITFPNGAPDPDYHIRAVIENQPRLSPRQSQLTKHLWDISGRYYHEIFPLDFHIIISGVASGESHGRPSPAPSDNAQVEILVQAHVRQPQLKEIVDRTAEELARRLETALANDQERI